MWTEAFEAGLRQAQPERRNTTAVIGRRNTTAVIGRRNTTTVIGLRNTNAVIGLRNSTEVMGRRSTTVRTELVEVHARRPAGIPT
jgi:hypothetical protein